MSRTLRISDQLLVLGTDLSGSGSKEIVLPEPPASAPSVTVNPSATGTAKVGIQLTGSDGSASGTPTPTVSARQWQYSTNGSTLGGNISGATSANYTISGTYEGQYVRLAVTWTNSEGTATGYSDWIGPVASASALLWPKANDTGYSGSLTAYSGPTTISVDDTLIENRIITDTLTIAANNVTIRNSLMDLNSWYGIIQTSGSNLLIEDCEIDGTGSSAMTGIAITSGTIRRCNIHGMVIAIKIWGNNCLIEYNYINDLQETSSNPDARHFDGLAQHSGSGTIIRYNAFHMPDPEGGTASTFITTQDGNTSNISIYGNLMLGNPSAPAYAENNNGYSMSGVEYEDNHMEKGIFGWILESGGGAGADVSNTKFDTTYPQEVLDWIAAA